MPEVEFICLANSRRPGGRCVAGLRMDGKGWVRPVNSIGGTIFRQQYTLDDGREAAIFDVIRVSLKEQCPQSYQPENWIVENEPWRLVRRLTLSEASTFLSSNISTSLSFPGDQLDRVYAAALAQNPVAASLALIEPDSIQWYITTNIKNRRQTRAKFELGGLPYDFVITDPQWEHRLEALPLGVHNRIDAGVSQGDRLLFTISLGAPKGGYCYKLVAAVIVLPTA